MIAIIWEFSVIKGCETEFEQMYGSEGEWTALNRHTRSYLGTSFLRDQNRQSRYLVIEYWSEMVVYEEHRTYRSDQIATLEARRTKIIESVLPLGIVSALELPDRSGRSWSVRHSRT